MAGVFIFLFEYAYMSITNGVRDSQILIAYNSVKQLLLNDEDDGAELKGFMNYGGFYAYLPDANSGVYQNTWSDYNRIDNATVQNIRSYTEEKYFDASRLTREVSFDHTVNDTTYYCRTYLDFNDAGTIEKIILVYINMTLYNSGFKINIVMRFLVIAIFFIGVLAIFFWGNALNGRIKKLKRDIDDLSPTNYQQPMHLQGSDELNDIARAIEQLRVNILENNRNKLEILQNISHDFNNPLSIIKGYGEAIAEGSLPAADANIIVRNADVLTEKVRKLILLNQSEHQELIKPSLMNVPLRLLFSEITKELAPHKLLNITIKSDSSTYLANYEELKEAFVNIINNNLRYAKRVISINVRKNVVTIFNDGEPIDPTIIKNLFTPYVKGQGGNFGIGLSITYKTLTKYGYLIKPSNTPKGVVFTIKPRPEDPSLTKPTSATGSSQPDHDLNQNVSHHSDDGE
jgi:two-component system sensor histidine kinase CssS